MPECYIRGSTIKYLRIPDEVIDNYKEDSSNRGQMGNRRGGSDRGGRGSSSQRGGRGGSSAGGGRGGYNNTNNNSNQRRGQGNQIQSGSTGVPPAAKQQRR